MTQAGHLFRKGISNEKCFYFNFRMYDTDSSGTIDAREMVEILSCMYAEHGVSEVGRDVSKLMI